MSGSGARRAGRAGVLQARGARSTQAGERQARGARGAGRRTGRGWARQQARARAAWAWLGGPGAAGRPGRSLCAQAGPAGPGWGFVHSDSVFLARFNSVVS